MVVEYQSPIDNETSIDDKTFVVSDFLINSNYSLNLKLQHSNFIQDTKISTILGSYSSSWITRFSIKYEPSSRNFLFILRATWLQQRLCGTDSPLSLEVTQ